MVPPTIRNNIGRLRRRERLLRFAWGAARWLALVVTLLLLAGLTDWLLDHQEETPWAVRVALFAAQVVAAAGAAFVFVLRPLFRRLPDDDLALAVEDRHPDLEHRLISALQFNRPGADTAGMSPELIAKVTREAEERAGGMDFAAIADHRRLGKSAAVAVPVLLVAALPFLLWPEVAPVLLARQFLGDEELPRSVYLASDTPEVWPSGEKVTLRFRATGKGVDPSLRGEVRVEPDGGPRDRYPLTFAGAGDDGAAYFTTEVPPSSADFTYRARMADGRTRSPGRVRFVPRPVVTEQYAAVQLPEFVGLKPDGGRYEQPQPRGDLVAIFGSSARVAVKVQKPVRTGAVQLLGLSPGDGRAPKAGPETITRTVPMAVSEDGTGAEAVFDLRPGENAYQITVADEHGFDNRPPPRRVIRLVKEEPPQVYLLREVFPPGDRFVSTGLAEDFEVEGMPVPLGGSVRIGYSATGPYGLGRAEVWYRLLKKAKSGEEPVQEEPWQVLPLPEVKGSEQTGAFDPRRGVFEHSGPRGQVPFHAVPSPEPETTLGRTVGGGRLDFKTTGSIPDGKGGYRDLQPDDQIEFKVKVYADPGGDPKKRPWAESEPRVKTVVSLAAFARWIDDTLQEESRLRKLDARQRGVFDGAGP